MQTTQSSNVVPVAKPRAVRPPTPPARTYEDLVIEWARANLVADATAYWDAETAIDAFELARPKCKGGSVWLADFEAPVREALRLDAGEPIRARLQDDLGLASFDPTSASVEVAYVVEGLLPANGVHMPIGLPENGKSWAAFELAVAVSQGRPFAGRFPTTQGRVVLLDWEVGSIETKRRLKLLGADERVIWKSYPRYNLTDPRFWAELEKAQPNLVVIDSLSGGAGTDTPETDARFAEPLREAARFCQRMHERRVERGEANPYCTFAVVHHSPKSATVSDAESLFRGSGSLRSAVDTAIYFDRPAGETDPDKPVFRATTVKTRKGYADPPPFLLSLTDTGGLRALDGSQKPKGSKSKGSKSKGSTQTPMTDEERIVAAVEAEPGITVTKLATDLEWRRETVSKAKGKAEAAGRIHTQGRGKATGLHPGPAPAVESVPESVPEADRERIHGNGLDPTKAL